MCYVIAGVVVKNKKCLCHNAFCVVTNLLPLQGVFSSLPVTQGVSLG